MKLTPMQQVVHDAFVAEGLDPALGLAIAQQESAFNPDASVVTGGDAARGGSYGLGQVSLKTALALDHTATIARLHNPAYNAKLMAQLCRQNQRLARTSDVAELASRYNSGKPFHLAPDSTRLIYAPHVLRYYAAWKTLLSADTVPAENSASSSEDAGQSV